MNWYAHAMTSILFLYQTVDANQDVAGVKEQLRENLEKISFGLSADNAELLRQRFRNPATA